MHNPAATSSPADPDRGDALRRVWGGRLRRLGQLTFYVIGVVLAVVLALLMIASVIDLSQPRFWGTFTQTDCETRPRGGCRPIGTWISDDGRTVLTDVYLDGWPVDGGMTRASYQPTALLGTDVVHVPALSGIGPWFIGGFLLWWVGYVLYKAAAWGDLTVPRSWVLPSRRRRRSTGLSPRRDYREALAEQSSEGPPGGRRSPS